MKLYRNKEWLKRMYDDPSLTQAEIAELAGCSRATLINWANKFGFGLRREPTPEIEGATVGEDEKIIPLCGKSGKGKFVIVDARDYEWLNQWRWNSSGNGYAARTVNLGKNKYERILIHRLITECPRGAEVDHINGNRLDNRRSNLRVCTRRENALNRRTKRNSFSGYKGVQFRKKIEKWVASIWIDGKHVHLGSFGDKMDAAKAYDEAAIKHYGEFAKVNID